MIFLTLFLIAGLALISYGIYVWRYYKPVSFNEGKVAIRGQVFNVALADTLAKRSQGLAGQTELAADQGMLFLFLVPFKYSFWMKGMNFPLDMVWITDDTIVGITPNIPAPQPGQKLMSLSQYYPPQAVNKVLEVSAGTTGKYGWQAGDKVEVTLLKDEIPQ